ncbi:Fic family protein [Caballeronia sp. LjRoot34]|uniref:Fic family protein n=1 Tax=Caballeronia sp. LjRoot34 TaxID=3342325 RepID=UPI003ED1051D
MAKRELYSAISDLLVRRAAAGQDLLSRREIAEAMGAPPATVLRYLDRLIGDGKVERVGATSAVRYRLPGRKVEPMASVVAASPAKAKLTASPAWSEAAAALIDELNVPLGARQPISYQRHFVDGYVPNQSYLLPQALANDLYQEGRSPGQQPAGTYARKVIEPLLIDLSFSSSRLEGNRYSRLDTEVLFDAGTADPADKDATMLLNHKRAIEFLIDDVPSYGLTAMVIRNLHTLLMQGLLNDEGALGSIRERVVNISNTVYIPSHVPSLLGEMLEQITEKARHIKNPVEAAFFLWVNLAYLQPFEDGNKRTSRLSANIPLLLYNCAPLSFLDVGDEDYARAKIGVYERLDTSIAADLFAWTYRRSIAKYAAQIDAAGVPDPFRARYREAINEMVSRIVRDREALGTVIAEFKLRDDEAARLIDMVRGDISRLGEHNFARYRLRLKELEQWISAGRPLIE